MTEKVKIALITVVGLIVAILVYSYNTPYQSCVRGAVNNGDDKNIAQMLCARHAN